MSPVMLALLLLGLTVSRGSYLGLLVGGGWALFLVREHVRRRVVIKSSLAGIVILFFVAAIIAYQNPEGFIDKFSFVGFARGVARDAGRS